MRCLISTIIRNREPHIALWSAQLQRLCACNPDITFDLVVLENDSVDGTKEVLEKEISLLETVFNDVIYKSVDYQWPYFGSIKAEERVKYLAKARNETLELADLKNKLSTYDKIVCIEPDIVYDPVLVRGLFDTSYDIASGYSVLPIGMGVPDWIYDSWATRMDTEDLEYTGPKVSKLPSRLNLASTFNCFCVYNAEPIAEGVRFSEINPLNGKWDCDTTTICFAFLQRGYDKIYMCRIPILHKP
jgi:hypothetical protein